MSERHLPVHPNLEQLKNQAKDLLRQIRSNEADAMELWKKYHPRQIDSGLAKLSDAQLVLARSYQSPSWPRLVLACKLIDAIWDDERETVRDLIVKHPRLLHEQALVRESSNWGPPMS